MVNANSRNLYIHEIKSFRKLWKNTFKIIHAYNNFFTHHTHTHTITHTHIHTILYIYILLQQFLLLSDKQ